MCKNLLLKSCLSTLAASMLISAQLSFAQQAKGEAGGRQAEGTDGKRSAISVYDRDRDGKISRVEWVAHFHELDSNGDGHFEVGEMPRGAKQAMTDGQVTHYDRNGDAKVTEEEFAAYFDVMDKDKNGTIEEAEYLANRQEFRERAKGKDTEKQGNEKGK